MKPEMKKMLMPYINEDHTAVTVGGFQYLIGRDLMTDTPEELIELLRYMDGTKTISKIAHFFKMEITECTELIESLAQLGIIQENISDTHFFSKEEVLYYSRNLNFFSWIDIEGKYYNYWDVQKKIKSSRVLLLGAGGTGSLCANSLARLGVGYIKIVDYDRVEVNNLNRQLFTYEDIGKQKTQVLKAYLNKVNPFIDIEIEEKKIETTQDIESLGSDFNLVICCIDKPFNINEIISEYTIKTKIPHIVGGYASTVLTSGIFTADSMQLYEMIECQKSKNYDAFKVSTVTEWEWENAIIAPVAAIAGNFSALYAFYFLTDLLKLKPSEVLHVDLFNLQNSHITYNVKGRRG